MISKLLIIASLATAYYALSLVKSTDRIRKPEVKNKISIVARISVTLAMIGVLIS
jgi:hypothetical protein